MSSIREIESFPPTQSPLFWFTNNGTLRMTTTKAYDLLNRLTNIQSTVGGSNVTSFNYVNNSANQRTSVTNVDNTYWVYTYDSLGQVTSGKKYWSDGTVVAGQQFTYGFDDIGNRQTAAAGGDQFGANLRDQNYSVNNLNQYTNRTVPGYVDVQGMGATNATVTVNNQATYRKGEYFRGEVSFDNTANSVYPSITNLAVLNNGTNPDIITNVTGNVLLPRRRRAGRDVQDQRHFFSYDGNGNVTALITAMDGSQSARYEYGPFAEPIRMTGPVAKLNSIRFSTQYADDVTGDVKCLFRDYCSPTGMWLNRDPIGELGFMLVATGRQPTTETESDEELFTGRRTNPRPNEANLYGFVLNDPQNRIDLLGLISFDGCDAGQQAEITAAWNAGCAKVNDPRFACCLNRSGLTDLLKRRCSWGNVKFYCRNNGTFWCNSNTCAHAWRSVLPGINAGRITVCFPLAQNCGSLAMPCLLMHELAHVVSASPLESPNSAAIRTQVCCQGL